MVNVEGSLSADLIAQQNFSPARRGFDTEEVRLFLVKVAAEIVALHERQTALEDARREAEYRAAHPSFDEETLLGAVGEETAHILKSAHEAAADIRKKAGENASRILKEAHQQAEALRAEAETVLARRSEEAESVAGRIREGARAEAERQLDQTRQQAKAIRAQAEAERNAMIEGAQATRERILSALSKKRNVAVAQVEQLRAGRERLLEAYQVVRLTLDQATAELARAEADARAAADAVRHRPLALDEPDGLDEDGDPPTNPTLPIIQARLRPPPPPAAPVVSGPAAAAPVVSGPAPAAPVVAALPAAAPLIAAPPAAGQAVDGPSVAAPVVADPVTPPPPVAEPTPKGATAEPARTAVGREGLAPVPAPISPASDDAPRGQTTVDPAEGRPPPIGPEPVERRPHANVESIFARIRADRAKAVAKEETVEQPVADADEVLLQRRDAAVVPIEGSLTRRLKRALQDDQNDLLDRLRNMRSSHKAVGVVLPARDAHRARFRDVARPFLGEALSAGAAFTSSLIPGVKAAEQPETLDAAADDLAEAIVEPLRRRLEHVLVAGDGDDPIILAEAVGGAYREWKTKRVEVVAADHITAAFTRGAYAAAPACATLRWLVEDADGPCADCDDNALAGDQPKGDAFPTGQRHPPAHPGCRCVVVAQKP